MKNLRFLAENDVSKFKIDLLMQNSRSAAMGLFRARRAERLILHQQSDFKFLDVILGQETSVFSKFHDFQMLTDHGPKPWANSNLQRAVNRQPWFPRGDS